MASSSNAFTAALLTTLVATPTIVHAHDDVLAPPDLPRGSYVQVPAVLTDVPHPQGHAAPHILYLNRCAGGVSISAGWPDDNTVNRSGILSGTVNFPEYPFGDASWNEMVAHARDIFSPFNIQITDVDPSPMPHDEAIICGSGSLAGFSGAGGVAPFTCGVIDAPITFTFPESLGDYPRSIAEVLAQEAAHAWGLEHEYKCEDPMTYLYGCGDKTFQDGAYPCGEYSARACECGGSDQNSYQYILGLFGSAVPDEAAPTATIVSPQDGDVFAVGDMFDIAVQVSDDSAVEVVELYLDGALSSADMSDPFGPWPVVDAVAGSYEIYIVAKDTSGKETMSDVVHFEVTEDGAPPVDPSDDDGGDSGGAGDSGDGGGSLDDAGDGGDDGGDGGGDDGMPGVLPPFYGLNGDAQGCACTSDPRTPMHGAWLFAPLLVWLRWRAHGRRSA
ncbi:MAG TPA: Ig-like domain-containing protein [Nannocystaceae bacterium]|nr:Ig-like domain-containing protein [Nannocystaceae bacterium]